MRIKSYFAETVGAAVQSARQEMGEDAMLVETRKAPLESQHLGAYEVVFGVADNTPVHAAPTARPATPVLSPGDTARLSAEMTQMRRQLEGIRLAMRSGLTAPRWLLPSSSLAEVFSGLLAADISGEIAQIIVDRLHAQLSAASLEDPAAIDSALTAELESRFTIEPSLGRSENPRIAALVGPPGSGKTTTLVKLAVAQGLAARRPVQLITLDNFRVGAADQLRSYAAILGVGFQAVETPVGLAHAVNEYRSKSLILIDTPGFSLAEMDGAGDLARALLQISDIDTHLVLSASTRSADLTRVVEAFEVFRPSKLLFTRLDETDSYGPIFCEAARTRKPLSFLTMGQRIPEDLSPASHGLLIDMILRDRPGRKVMAA